MTFQTGFVLLVCVSIFVYCCAYETKTVLMHAECFIVYGIYTIGDVSETGQKAANERVSWYKPSSV